MIRSARRRRTSPRACGICAIAALGVLTAAALPAIASSPDEFWAKREAAYREDPRGPFTAIAAHYLKPGESLTIFAREDSIGIEPIAQGESLHVALSASGAFDVKPAAPLDSLRLGAFLLSCDKQADDLGRVLVYDPALLASRFHGFPVFAHDSAWRLEARAEIAAGDPIAVGTTRGLEKSLVRAAVLSFERNGAPHRLTGFREPGESGALFVPFRDETSGGESYGVGRYLRVEWKEGDSRAVIDFNRATNPWCAYSPYYNCVLPPEENHLALEVRAGEMAPRDSSHAAH
jgi:hypothetical protein